VSVHIFHCKKELTPIYFPLKHYTLPKELVVFTFQSQRRFAPALVAVLFSAVLLAAINKSKADIIYQIIDDQAVQNGYMLSGTITTDGNMGNLSSSDIRGWSWSVTNGVNTYSANSTQPGTSSGISPGDIFATSSYIALYSTTDLANAGGMGMGAPISVPGHGQLTSYIQWTQSTLEANAFTSAVYFEPGFPNNGTPWWTDLITSTPYNLPNGWEIANDGVAAVPEPSSLTLLASAATVIGAGYCLRRYKGRKRRRS
jgi:hypothetical protein